MSTYRPRHARKEIRDFADWLVSEGWEYAGEDTKGHSIWGHADAADTYKLPETPRHFNVRGARADAMKLLGRTVAGKRKGGRRSIKRTDPQVEAARKRASERAEAKDLERVAREAEIRATRESERRRREIEELMGIRRSR